MTNPEQREKIARDALEAILGSGKGGTWKACVEPLVARFDVADKLGQKAVHNAEGSRALAELLRSMAMALDTAVENTRTALAAIIVLDPAPESVMIDQFTGDEGIATEHAQALAQPNPLDTPRPAPDVEREFSDDEIGRWLQANCGVGLPYHDAVDEAGMLHGLAYVLRQIEGTNSYKVNIGQTGPATSAIRMALRHFARSTLARSSGS